MKLAFDNTIERVIYTDLVNNKSLSEEYLSNFNDSVFGEYDNRIIFKGEKKITELYSVDLLSNTNKETKSISFDVLYIKALDIIYLDLYYLDSENNVIEEENIVGHPYYNEHDVIDIRFDFKGYTFYASTFTANKTSDNVTTLGFILTELDDGGGSSSIYPIINISYSITSLDDALSLGNPFVNVIDLFTEGPVDYLLYQAKLILIRENFESNITRSKPTNYINTQMVDPSWLEWEYGVSDLRHSGCGIFALYNFLYDTTAVQNKPDLASLIALIQAMNADILFGKWGVNPITEINESTFLESVEILVLNRLYDIAVTELIPNLAQSLIDSLPSIEETPWWLQTILNISYEYLYHETVASMIVILTTALLTDNFFINYFIDNMNSISDVLTVYGIENSQLVTLSYAELVSVMDSNKYMILTYYNSDNIFDGLHTVYVNHNDVNSYIAYNNGFRNPNSVAQLDSEIEQNVDEIYKILASLTITTFTDDNIAESKDKFFSAIVIKE